MARLREGKQDDYAPAPELPEGPPGTFRNAQALRMIGTIER